VLQNCTGFVDGGTGSCFDTCVPCDVNGTEEYNIKFEDAININDGMQEVISFPPINTENEVRFRACVRLWQRMLFGNLLPLEGIGYYIYLSRFLLYFEGQMAF
jgi:hypothetical protein